MGPFGVLVGRYVHDVFRVNDVSEDAGAKPRIRGRLGAARGRHLFPQSRR